MSDLKIIKQGMKKLFMHPTTRVNFTNKILGKSNSTKKGKKKKEYILHNSNYIKFKTGNTD